jgi:hypothetical protein
LRRLACWGVGGGGGGFRALLVGLGCEVVVALEDCEYVNAGVECEAKERA